MLHFEYIEADQMFQGTESQAVIEQRKLQSNLPYMPGFLWESNCTGLIRSPKSSLHGIPLTKNDIEYTIDEHEKIITKEANFIAPNAFNALRSRLSTAVYIFLAELTFDAPKHFHAYLDTEIPKNTRTVTIIIPAVIRNEVTEKVYFNYQEHTIEEENALYDIKQNFGCYETIVGKVDTVKFPKPGQYLMFDFNSTKTLHWSQHSNENDFLLLIAATPE